MVEAESEPSQRGDGGSDRTATSSAPGTERARVLRAEVALVLGVSLGASAVYAVVSLIAKLTRGPLSAQRAVLNPSQAPGRPWLDLTYQLLGIAFDLVPVLLALHLLARDPGDARGLLGLNRKRLRFDAVTGVTLAAIIGIPGLGLYVAARAAGLNATVVPAALPQVWWAVPVLAVAAIQNGLLEEIVVVGYLVTRLRATGVSFAATIAISSVLRGTYHLYQGYGAFAGNAIMGVLFALFFLRTRRVWPLVIAHSVLDIVSFVGYALLADHLRGVLGG